MPVLVACSASFAQVAPAASGSTKHFGYTFRYAQSAQFSKELGNWQTSTPSAEVDYTNGNTRAPFDLSYAGGYTWSLKGPSYNDGLFQGISIHQMISGRKWNAAIADNASYRPQAPVTGFSGIPGIGEPISTPVTSSQSILTQQTHTIDNNAEMQFSGILNRAFSVHLDGSYDLLRYPDANGLDTDSLDAHGQLIRRLDARNSLTAQYVYSRFSYPSLNFTINTDSAMGVYDRIWRRALHTSFAIGPAWISSSSSQLIPPSTRIAANAAITFHLRRGSIFLGYDRGISGGSGYLLGQKTDSIDGGYSRDFQRAYSIELTGGYRRMSALNQVGLINAEYGGIQASRRLGRYASFFANYTVIAQSSSISLPGNVIQEPQYNISFGTAISSRPANRF
jgi:hypothetical protein